MFFLWNSFKKDVNLGSKQNTKFVIESFSGMKLQRLHGRVKLQTIDRIATTM